MGAGEGRIGGGGLGLKHLLCLCIGHIWQRLGCAVSHGTFLCLMN